MSKNRSTLRLKSVRKKENEKGQKRHSVTNKNDVPFTTQVRRGTCRGGIEEL